MAISQQTRRRWDATSSCLGVLVADACWVLGGPGQGCPATCGDSQMDEQMMHRQSSLQAVVLALTVRYGLPPWRQAKNLDQPCEPVPFNPQPRAREPLSARAFSTCSKRRRGTAFRARASCTCRLSFGHHVPASLLGPRQGCSGALPLPSPLSTPAGCCCSCSVCAPGAVIAACRRGRGSPLHGMPFRGETSSRD